MAASCKAGECDSCSGGVYRPRQIAGQTVQNWFIECGCGCHLAGCAHVSAYAPAGYGAYCMDCGETLE